MKGLIIFVLGIFITISSCAGVNKRLSKGKKPLVENVSGSVSTSDEKIVPETPIIEVEEKLVPIDEKLPDPHRYFVIIGSFRNPDNAKKYQEQIRKEGFIPEIIRNESGLYRVSVMATDDVTIARNNVRRIWSEFPKYSDTWLLIQIKTP